MKALVYFFAEILYLKLFLRCTTDGSCVLKLHFIIASCEFDYSLGIYPNQTHVSVSTGVILWADYKAYNNTGRLYSITRQHLHSNRVTYLNEYDMIPAIGIAKCFVICSFIGRGHKVESARIPVEHPTRENSADNDVSAGVTSEASRQGMSK